MPLDIAQIAARLKVRKWLGCAANSIVLLQAPRESGGPEKQSAVSPDVPSTAISGEGPEPTVARFFHDFRDRDTGSLRYLVSRPRRTVVAAGSLLRLPVLEAVTTQVTPEAAVVDHHLAQRHTLRRFLPHASVLVLPREPGMYAIGPSKQTVRRMARKAERRGVVCSVVDDPAERRQLISTFDHWERINPDAHYRNVEASNADCLDYRLWTIARSAAGEPLVLSVTPADGEWALLRYFRTLGSGTEQSVARYALMDFLAEHLVRDGVRYLFDQTSPARLSNGLRHYQRMVGFRLFRIRVSLARPGAAGASAAHGAAGAEPVSTRSPCERRAVGELTDPADQ